MIYELFLLVKKEWYTIHKFMTLFLSFAKIGTLTFGGGYAMLPMIQKEVVEKQNWATEQEIMDIYAIGQCTPGVIAVNTATFIGYKQNGIMGAICATLGMITPSILIILVIASSLQNLMDFPIVSYAFSGIRVAVAVLVLDALIKLFRKSVLDLFTFGIFLVTFLLGVFNVIPIIYIILIAGLVGAIKVWVKEKIR
ncbi:MAG: chromate transporter [Oscillospiraceae bacterium]